MEHVTNIKNHSRCEICGSKDNLQFHHKNRLMKYKDISYLVNKGEDDNVILKELEKCILVCDSCHKHLHKIEDVCFMNNLGERISYFSHLDNYLIENGFFKLIPSNVMYHFDKKNILYRDVCMIQSLKKIIDERIRKIKKSQPKVNTDLLYLIENYYNVVFFNGEEVRENGI